MDKLLSKLQEFLSANATRRIERNLPFIAEPQTVNANIIDPERGLVINEPIDVVARQALIEPDGLDIPLNIYFDSVIGDTDSNKISPLLVQNLTDAMTRGVLLYDTVTLSEVSNINFFGNHEIFLDEVVTLGDILDETSFTGWFEMDFGINETGSVSQITFYGNNTFDLESVNDDSSISSIEFISLTELLPVDTSYSVSDIEFAADLHTIYFEIPDISEVGDIVVKDKFVDGLYNSGYDLLIDTYQSNINYENLAQGGNNLSEFRFNIEFDQHNIKFFVPDSSSLFVHYWQTNNIELDQTNLYWTKSLLETQSHLNILKRIDLGQESTSTLLKEDYIPESAFSSYFSICLDQSSLAAKSATFVKKMAQDTFNIRTLSPLSEQKNTLLKVYYDNRIGSSFLTLNTFANQTQSGNQYLKIEFTTFKGSYHLFSTAISQETKTTDSPNSGTGKFDTHTLSAFTGQVTNNYENQFSVNSFFGFDNFT
jgi:hypothetical protein